MATRHGVLLEESRPRTQSIATSDAAPSGSASGIRRHYTPWCIFNLPWAAQRNVEDDAAVSVAFNLRIDSVLIQDILHDAEANSA